MNNNRQTLAAKILFLKEVRLQILELHKLLLDIERSKFERQNGQVTSGQFLSLLLNEPDLQWLRKFSTLIVQIDEMLDLDDGYTEDMVDSYLDQIRNLIDFNVVDEEFEKKYKNSIQTDATIAVKHSELKKLFA
jgi:hypothetical protein